MADVYGIQITKRDGGRGTVTTEIGVSELLDNAVSAVPGVSLWRGPNGWGPMQGLVTAADAATVTFDFNLAHTQQVTIGGNRTFAINTANMAIGLWFRIFVNQDATGSRTVTWFNTVRWPGGSPPTLTTTTGKTDMFDFVCIATGSYLNVNVSQNM